MKGFFRRIQDSRSGTRKTTNDPSTYQVWLPPTVNNDNRTRYRAQPEPLDSTDNGDRAAEKGPSSHVPRPPEFNYEPGTTSSSYNYSTYPSGRGYSTTAHVRTASTPTTVRPYPYPNEHASVPILPPQAHMSREPPRQIPTLQDHDIRHRRERSEGAHPSDRSRKQRLREEDVDLVQNKARNMERPRVDVDYSRQMDRRMDQKRELEEGRDMARRVRERKDKEKKDEHRKEFGDTRDRERRHRERKGEERRDMADSRDRDRRDRNDRGELENTKQKGEEDETRVKRDRDRGGQKKDSETRAGDRRDREERKERTRESNRDDDGGKELLRGRGKDQAHEKERHIETREKRDMGHERDKIWNHERRDGRDTSHEREREIPWEQRRFDGQREMRGTTSCDPQRKTSATDGGGREQDGGRKASELTEKPRTHRERIGERNRRNDTQKDLEREAESALAPRTQHDVVGSSDRRERKREGRRDRYDSLGRHEPEKSAWGYMTAAPSHSHGRGRQHQPLVHEESTSDSSPRRQLPKSLSKHNQGAHPNATSAPPDLVPARLKQPASSSSTHDQPGRVLVNPSSLSLVQHETDTSITEVARGKEYQASTIQVSSGAQHFLSTTTTSAYNSQPSHEMALIILLFVSKVSQAQPVQKPPLTEIVGAEPPEKRTDRYLPAANPIYISASQQVAPREARNTRHTDAELSTLKATPEKQPASSFSSTMTPQIQTGYSITAPQSSRLQTQLVPAQSIVFTSPDKLAVQSTAPPFTTDQLPHPQTRHQVSSTTPPYVSGTSLAVDMPSRKRTESSVSKDLAPLAGPHASRPLHNLAQPDNQSSLPSEAAPNMGSHRLDAKVLESTLTGLPSSQQNTPHVGPKDLSLTSRPLATFPILKQSSTQAIVHSGKEPSLFSFPASAVESDLRVTVSACLHHDPPEVSKLTPPKGSVAFISPSMEVRSELSKNTTTFPHQQLQAMAPQEQAVVDRLVDVKDTPHVLVLKASLDAGSREQGQPSHIQNSLGDAPTGPNIIQTSSFVTQPPSVNLQPQELPMRNLQTTQFGVVHQLPHEIRGIRPSNQDKVDKPETARSRLPSTLQSISQGSEEQGYGSSQYTSKDRIPPIVQSSSIPSASTPLYTQPNQAINHAPSVIRMSSETPFTAIPSIPTLYNEHRREVDVATAAIDARASAVRPVNAEEPPRHPNTAYIARPRDDGKGLADQHSASPWNADVSKLVAEYEARSLTQQARTNPGFHIPRSSTSLGHRQVSGERGFPSVITESRGYVPLLTGSSQEVAEKVILASTIERPATSLGSRIHRVDKFRLYDPLLKPGVQIRPSIAPQFHQSASGGSAAPAPSVAIVSEPITRQTTEQVAQITLLGGDAGAREFKPGALEALPVKHRRDEPPLTSEYRAKDLLHKPDLNQMTHRAEQPPPNKQADFTAQSAAAKEAPSLETEGIKYLHTIDKLPRPAIDKANNLSGIEDMQQRNMNNDSASRLHRHELSGRLAQERPKDLYHHHDHISAPSLIQNAQLAELLSNTPLSHETIPTSRIVTEPNPAATAPLPVLQRAYQNPERFPDEFGSGVYPVQKSAVTPWGGNNLLSVSPSRENPPSRTLEAHTDPQKSVAPPGEPTWTGLPSTVQGPHNPSQVRSTASLRGSVDKMGSGTHAPAEASSFSSSLQHDTRAHAVQSIPVTGFPPSDYPYVQSLPPTASRSKDPSKGSYKHAPATQSSSLQPVSQPNPSYTNLPVAVAAETSSNHPPHTGSTTRNHDYHPSSHKVVPIIASSARPPTNVNVSRATTTQRIEHTRHRSQQVPVANNPSTSQVDLAARQLPPSQVPHTSQPAHISILAHNEPLTLSAEPSSATTRNPNVPTRTAKPVPTQRIEHTRHRSQQVPVANHPSTSQVDLTTRHLLPPSQVSHTSQPAHVSILPHNEPLSADPSPALTWNPNASVRTAMPVHPSESRPYYHGTSTIQPTTSNSQTRPLGLMNTSQSRSDAILLPPNSTKVSTKVLRKPSQDSVLLQTPSSLAPTLLQPTVSQTSIPASFSSQTSLRKRGLFGLFRSKATQPPEEPSKSSTQETRKELKKKSEKHRESPPQGVRVQHSNPTPAAHAVMQPTSEKSQHKVFTPFRYLTTKRNRRVSAASLEAQDGTAPNTIMGSPTASMHSTQPPTIQSPPLRDVFAATQEWRRMEAAEMRELTGGKLRRARPGVVFDVAEDPNEERRRKIKPQRQS